MERKVINLMAILIIFAVSIIFCPRTNAALLKDETIYVVATQIATPQGIILYDDTLEPIPEFGFVSDAKLTRMLESGDQDEWPSIVYVRNESRQFFNPNTGNFVGEIGKIEKNPDSIYLFRIITPTRIGDWMSIKEIIEQIGFLTALNKNGKNEYVMITDVYWKDTFFNALSRPSRLLAVKYVDKNNRKKIKYLDLFTTQSGWNHVFYQPKSQQSE